MTKRATKPRRPSAPAPKLSDPNPHHVYRAELATLIGIVRASPAAFPDDLARADALRSLLAHWAVGLDRAGPALTAQVEHVVLPVLRRAVAQIDGPDPLREFRKLIGIGARAGRKGRRGPSGKPHTERVDVAVAVLERVRAGAKVGAAATEVSKIWRPAITARNAQRSYEAHKVEAAAALFLKAGRAGRRR
jgi:hypothetical protein